MPAEFVHITLDPPYLLDSADANKVLIGWCEVDDEQNPDIEVTINGVKATLIPRFRPEVRAYFPNMQVRGIRIEADFREMLRDASKMQESGGFMLVVDVRSDQRRRRFEYAVTQGWMDAVFGCGYRPYPIPPDQLQVRVAGAAVGAFVASGDRVADQLEELLSMHAHGFPTTGRVHDFGCGPGRVIQRLASRYRDVDFSGSDIDADAISWCASQIGSVGRFFVNGALPPMALDANEIDLVYSISVFTHLPEDMQHAWLAELNRVIKPGGILITTKLNPAAYSISDDVADSVRRTGFGYYEGETLVDGLPEFYKLTYHTDDYIRTVWQQYFDIVHIGPHGLNDTQDALVLRRPN